MYHKQQELAQQYKRGMKIMKAADRLAKIKRDLESEYYQTSVWFFETEAMAEAYYNNYNKEPEAYRTDKSFHDIVYIDGIIFNMALCMPMEFYAMSYEQYEQSSIQRWKEAWNATVESLVKLNCIDDVYADLWEYQANGHGEGPAETLVQRLLDLHYLFEQRDNGKISKA